ncbi:pyridoxamine 5'-phosphate oxidase family protein [Hymenobacter roseosalivarius]|nr:pyridoxamine 5'-phosphate oxidase family protein [Hymenobacter roseosalivarius]
MGQKIHGGQKYAAAGEKLGSAEPSVVPAVFLGTDLNTTKTLEIMAEQVAVSNDVSKLIERIKDIRIAMMTTAETNGMLHSRPMYTQQPDEDGTLWFFTERDSAKIDEVQQDRHINLGYSQPDDNLYVSVSGTASVVNDRQKIKDLWSEGLRAWFPKGSDDPNISLLKVDIERGEYWDQPSNVLVRAFGYVKAVTTGERYQPTGDEHTKVNPQ